VNPDHLFLGSHLDNMKDMVQKGRAGSGRGELNPYAKLTERDVVEIRRRVSAGETQKSVAHEYEVDIATINKIVHRKTWPHVCEDTELRLSS
jgi:hypothetical protein